MTQREIIRFQENFAKFLQIQIAYAASFGTDFEKKENWFALFLKEMIHLSLFKEIDKALIIAMLMSK